MIYGSVCSGIEAATAAWHPLGWRAAFFAEIDRFPSRVLRHHYPDVPNAGDFTTIQEGQYAAIDLLVGGTPCQDFSIAGLRAGLAGKRGQLTIEFAGLAHRLAAKARTRWVVWENVPGVLSIDDGRAFALFLSALAGRTVRVPEGGWQNAGILPGARDGFGLAWRVLDAQFAGVPQRRRRVFVVGHLGDWRRAAAVLFERHSLSGHPAPRREKGQGFARDIAPCLGASGRGFERTGDTRGQDWIVASTSHISHCLNGGMGRQDFETETLLAVGGFPDCSHEITGTLLSNRSEGGGSSRSYLATTMAVRRLTPRECERLQGFPDDYTKIDAKTADGPRYKALGNSMAVPVMRWIGERIQAVEAISCEESRNTYAK